MPGSIATVQASDPENQRDRKTERKPIHSTPTSTSHVERNIVSFRRSRLVAFLATGVAGALMAGTLGWVVAATSAPPASGLWVQLNEAPIDPRFDAAAFPTSDGFVVWGGYEVGTDGATFPLTDGALLSLDEGAWTQLPEAPLSEAFGRTTISTGDSLFVWGGEFGNGEKGRPDDGAAFSFRQGRWSPLPPSPRWSLAGHSMIWSGRQMLIWGGIGLSKGLRFSPSETTWTRLPDAPIPWRTSHGATWTEGEMFVWGGQDAEGEFLDDGAAFNPRTNRWRLLPRSPLGPRNEPTLTPIKNGIAIWGGWDKWGPRNDGAILNLRTGRWHYLGLAPIDNDTRGARVLPVGGSFVVLSGKAMARWDRTTSSWRTIERPPDGFPIGPAAAVSESFVFLWSGLTEVPDHLTGQGIVLPTSFLRSPVD